MTTLAEKTYSTRDVAEMLGVRRETVWCWMAREYRGTGSGNRIELTPVDVMVCRALFAITGGHKGSQPQTSTVCARAEAAIRAEPRRYLAMTPDAAATFDDLEDVARWCTSCRPGGLWLYDLRPEAA